MALSQEYVKHFERQTANPAARSTVTLTGSPFTYTAGADGVLIVNGGTVSAVSYLRGSSTINSGVVAGPFPLKTSDRLRITYTVAPTVTFLPD